MFLHLISTFIIENHAGRYPKILCVLWERNEAFPSKERSRCYSTDHAEVVIGGCWENARGGIVPFPA